MSVSLSDSAPNPGYVRAAEGVVALAIGLTASVFAQQALRRFYAVHNHTFDLALYARLAHGMAGGDFHSSILDLSFFSAHAPLALLPLGWLGRVFGTVQVLLVAQAACVCLAALPIYRLGLALHGPVMGAAAALSYLLYPNLSHVATYEFHPGNLALPLIAWALLALYRCRPRAVMLCACGALLCRDDLALTTLLVAAVAGLSGQRRLGLQLAFLSAGYFVATQLLAASAAGPRVGSLDLHFGPWGGTPLGLPLTLVQDPQRVWSHFTTSARLTYLPRVLMPLLMLPLLAPRALLPALPVLAMNLISVFPTTTFLYSHYLTPAVPVLFVALLHGARQVPKRWMSLLPAAVLGAGLVAAWAAGGTPLSRGYEPADFRVDGSSRVRLSVIAAVPDGASVQAPDPLLPHLAERDVVHRAPPPERGTDVVILDLSHRARFAGTDTLLRTQEEPIVRNWLARSDYGVAVAYPGYVMLQRGQDPRSGFSARHFVMLAPMGASEQRLTDCLSLVAAEIVTDGVAFTFRAHERCPSDLALRIRDSVGHARVDLLMDGLLSPAHLRSGDLVRSIHAWPGDLARDPIKIGLIRSSGARPTERDPTLVQVRLGR